MDPRVLIDKQVRLDLVAAAAVSAGTDVTGAAVDRRGFDSVRFFATIATANAGNFIKVQQSPDGSTGWSDLEGSASVAGDDGDVASVTVHRATERFLRGVIDRGGANTATGEMYALLSGADSFPTTDAAEVDHVTVHAPAEGTP